METALGLIGSAVVGALLTYLYFLLRRSRKELGYEVLSANVIIPKLRKSTPDIQVTVRSALLGDSSGDGPSYVPVERILGFRIRLRNTGNQVLENQHVAFTLDDNATIISVEVEEFPDLGGRTIESSVELPPSNVAVATIPFLNPGKEVIFSIQSVNNQGTACSVSAGAPGLKYFDIGMRRLLIWMCITVPGTLLLTVPAGVLKLFSLYGQEEISNNDVIQKYIFYSLWAGYFCLALTAPAVSRMVRRRWRSRRL